MIDPAPLFRPFRHGPLTLPNRIVMAPMTRNFSPGGIPTEAVADYYARRAAAGVGCIVTEGVAVAHPTAHGYRDVPVLDPSVPLKGFTKVVRDVKAHGASILPQLWHVGSIRKAGRPPVPEAPSFGPSAVPHPAYGDKGVAAQAMDEADLDAIVTAFARSAALARATGFDGVEIHGAHGYLLDQFLWSRTNVRDDRYGVAQARGTGFPAAIVRAIRAATAPDFPIVYRFSQWKLGDYEEVILPSEQALEEFLGPLADAGVDVFHPSTRRWNSPAFPGATETLPAMTKRLTGMPTIAVGSVGLDLDITATAASASTTVTSIDTVIEALDRGDFDLVAVGRALLAEPRWAELVREGKLADATPYSKAQESELR